MSAKFTKGPWEVCKLAAPEYSPQFGVYSGEAARDHAIVKGDNAQTDARLIAAAPELLAALRELVFVINQDDDGDFFICKEAAQEIENARAAIAKATE